MRVHARDVFATVTRFLFGRRRCGAGGRENEPRKTGRRGRGIKTFLQKGIFREGGKEKGWWGGQVERSRKCPRTEASRTEKHVFSRATSSNESFNDHPRSERVNKANTDSKVYE